jgi:hypothetical protein
MTANSSSAGTNTLQGDRWSFSPQRIRSQRFSQFLSALCVLCGIIEPAFASNTQEEDYRVLEPAGIDRALFAILAKSDNITAAYSHSRK